MGNDGDYRKQVGINYLCVLLSSLSTLSLDEERGVVLG